MANAVDRLKAAIADRYTVERELGAGGMATVYLAEDLKHHRQVAVKVLKPELAAAIGQERFLREIEITARLAHPHILPLLDSGAAGELLYYLMPYVDGESLRQRLERERQFSVDETLEITRDVGDALSYAHSIGIVHRDIKPENILFEAGHAVLSDFGIARAVTAAGGKSLTETGFLMGTPAYMSPEQTTGEYEVDGRGDVYSLACVVYEMLAGEPPFTGPTPQAVLARHAVDPVPPLRTVRATVPDAVDAAVTRALAKVPADRFRTPDEFATALVSGPPAEKSIAVLPFANMSADRENEYFSDGLSEDLINALTHIKGFRVAARTSAFSFKGQSVDARTIGQTLNVKTVLEGSVQKAGNRLRVTAELVNAEDGYHVWSEQYDRVMADVFTIQDEITGAIVDALKIELLADEKTAVTKKHTDDLDAYHLYLKGRYHWNRGNTEAFWKAIDHFDEAIRVDPSYARAYAGLADAYAGLGDAGHSAISPKQAFSSAKRAIEQALEIDDSLADAHSSLAHLKMHEFEWSAAERGFIQATKLNPNYATAYRFYAFYFVSMGKPNEAITNLERALELDPVSLAINTDLGVVSYFARRYEDATVQYQKVLDMDPTYSRAYVTMGSAYAQMGKHEDAVAAFRKAMALSGDRSKVAALGRAYGLAGKREKALECVAELRALSEQRYITPYAIALIYASMGETDQALSWLQDAYDQRVSELIFLKVDPFLDKLHTDSRFVDLLEKVGFE
jgi:serine/threonine-protein kinase